MNNGNMEPNLLGKLPPEILMHIFKQFLDLPELWCLAQVSRDMNAIATSIIKKQWFIDNKTPTLATSLFKIQTHAAMIGLSCITLRLLQRIKIYDPYAYPPFLSIDRHLRQQQRRQQEHEEFPLFSNAPQQPHLEEEEDQDQDQGEEDQDEEDSSDTSSIFLYTSPSSSPLSTFTFPPTIEPGLDDIANESGFIIERFKYHSERLHYILLEESRLHQRILHGLLGNMFSGKMDYPIRSAMDVIFHHAVSISSGRAFKNRRKGYMIRGRRPNFAAVLACTSSEIRSYAAATSRLFCAMMTRFWQSERMVTMALWDIMTVFLTFTEHRLSVAIKALVGDSSEMGQVVEEMLLNTTYKLPEGLEEVLSILFRITSCFDLIGACYVAQVLKENSAQLAVRKICAILEKEKLLLVKKAMLMNLVDVWLSMDRTVAHSNLRSMVQQELDK